MNASRVTGTEFAVSSLDGNQEEGGDLIEIKEILRRLPRLIYNPALLPNPQRNASGIWLGISAGRNMPLVTGDGTWVMGSVERVLGPGQFDLTGKCGCFQDVSIERSRKGSLDVASWLSGPRGGFKPTVIKVRSAVFFDTPEMVQRAIRLKRKLFFEYLKERFSSSDDLLWAVVDHVYRSRNPIPNDLKQSRENFEKKVRKESPDSLGNLSIALVANAEVSRDPRLLV